MATPSPHPPQVLLVDDEPDIRQALGMFLEFEGFGVDMAANGQEALETLRQRKFDLVISDIRMPVLDGIAFLEALRGEKKPAPPVILMTGFSDYSEADCRSRGAYAVVRKPFDPDRLLRTIQQSLASVT